jgi:ABC-type spermidine/putrescine transport system permease subunit I
MTARFRILCIAPVFLVVFILLVLPLLFVIDESVREFIPGRVGAVADARFTFDNYFLIFAPAYAGFFLKTYWLGFVGALVSILIGFPLAYYLARSSDSAVRSLLLGLLIVMMFLSALVRVYSLELTFGTVGVVRPLLEPLSIDMNSRLYLEALVVAGLLHVTVPIAALTLIGTIQNVNPRLAEAAQSLGASRIQAVWSVTIPLSLQGILSAFLISFTLGVSAFVIPWILGKGRVLFVSNLIYSRFSEMANYPSGAAMSIIMLLLSLLIVYAISRASKRISPDRVGMA